MKQQTLSAPHNNQITRYRQNSTVNSGALVHLSQAGTASACTGDLLLGWDGRNKKPQGCKYPRVWGTVKGSLAQAEHLKSSFCCTERICQKFQGRNKRKNLKSVMTGKNWKLFSISSHGFGSGLQKFKRSKQ